MNQKVNPKTTEKRASGCAVETVPDQRERVAKRARVFVPKQRPTEELLSPSTDACAGGGCTDAGCLDCDPAIYVDGSFWGGRNFK